MDPAKVWAATRGEGHVLFMELLRLVQSLVGPFWPLQYWWVPFCTAACSTRRKRVDVRDTWVSATSFWGSSVHTFEGVMFEVLLSHWLISVAAVLAAASERSSRSNCQTLLQT